jgi:hypothetical protein
MMRKMRLRSFVLASLLLLSTTSCKKLFSLGKGDGGAAGSGILSTLATLVGFEGEIDMNIDMGVAGAAVGMAGMTVNMKIKGDRVRIERSVPGVPSSLTGATIIDGGKKKSYMLMPATKEYMVTELEVAMTTATTGTPAAPKPVITKTGRSDKVAGYACDIVTVTTAGTGERTEFCMSKGLTLFGMGMGPFSSFGKGSGYDEVFKEGFPLRIEVFDPSGARTMKAEATRIEKKQEPDSEFEVPVGYTEMSMPSMGGYGSGGP